MKAANFSANMLGMPHCKPPMAQIQEAVAPMTYPASWAKFPPLIASRSLSVIVFMIMGI
jgi:hypothetical protein